VIIVAIIQARMGSTRLPGKVMKELQGKSVLQHVIDRVSKVNALNEIIIATTKHPIDDVIVDEALKAGATVYRGSEEDVLSRYYEAALESHADIIIRITSDCPLIDPILLSEILEFYRHNKYDYVSNTLRRTYPRGLDVEVFSFSSLKKACDEAQHSEYREHVTPYIYNNSETFKIHDFSSRENFSQYRWTLDTIEDWILIKEIYDALYKNNEVFSWKEAVELMEQKPYLTEINAHVEQKKISIINRTL
jgi:spore coat polysaccharide biosynthesis protein SpsF